MSFLGQRRTPVVIGHRGGRGPDWPAENTLAAFDRARAEGAHGVELDVRACATGEVVVFHDPSLTRMTAGADNRPVASVSLTELRRLPLGRSTDRIPMLSEILDWAGRHAMALNVELKHDVPHRLALARAAAPLLARASFPVLASSFDPLVLATLGVLAPRVPRALLTDAGQRYAPLLHAAAGAVPRALTALHVERTQARLEAIRAWKRRGLRVGVWTVNDPDEARALAALGVDLLITDRAATLRNALSQWFSAW